MPESPAEIIVEPIAIQLAIPLLAAAAPVATDASEEVHATWAVRSWTEPSVKVPVAMNVCVVPSAIRGNAGVTAIELSVALEIVSVVEPTTHAHRKKNQTSMQLKRPSPGKQASDRRGADRHETNTKSTHQQEPAWPLGVAPTESFTAGLNACAYGAIQSRVLEKELTQ
jgi:hypothetical protein